MSDYVEKRSPNVYQPAKDSDLLTRATDGHIAPDDLVLEVGTGSGYVAATVAERDGARTIGSDLNPHACRQARERGVETVQADLLTPFGDDAFDAVLFNPPYLPTEPGDEHDDWMEVALSGGETGRRVIEPFLETVGRVLAPGGAVYMLVSSLTDVAAVVDLAADQGFSAVALVDESYPFETLTVLKLLK